jgi:Glycosyltransferase family 87
MTVPILPEDHVSVMIGGRRMPRWIMNDGSDRINSSPSAAFGAMKGWWHDPRCVWVCALIPHAVAIAFAGKSIARGHIPGNLDDFVGAAREMLRGGDLYAGGTGQYCYPPLIAFLYQPLAMLTPTSAAVASLCINTAVSVLTLTLVARVLTFRITGREDPLLVARVALIGAVCTADKIRAEFNMLETNVFMLLAFTAAMRWVDKRPWLAGLALGFAFNIKYLPIVLVPYLLLRRRWSAVGWFAVFAAVFGVLPALSMGWSANAHAWGQASAGILGLFGMHLGSSDAAHIKPLTNPISVSVTSGIARLTGLPSPLPIVLAAGIGILFCVFALIVYRKNKFPVFAWPSVEAQSSPPFRGLLSIEWMGMLLLTLVFSPFTNARHLYMLMDVNIAAGALLLASRGVVPRGPLVVGAMIMAAGITLPPGGETFRAAEEGWRAVGGPAWCMLIMYIVLIWTNIRFQRASADAVFAS